jgi:hypothetical protein
MAGIAVGNKILWVGDTIETGPSNIATCLVEIRDVNSGTSTIDFLFGPATGLDAVKNNSKVIFFRPWGNDRDKFDIYDIGTGKWSIGILPQPMPYQGTIIAVNNIFYVLGGYVNGIVSNQVWKLEF